MTCNTEICAIPCDPFPPQSDVCNTLTVAASRTVDYDFAPIIGFDQGDTGLLLTAACKGACGVATTSPAEIALVVDRTGSMSPGDRAAAIAASEVFLEGLAPSLHDVALGTIGRSESGSPSCPTEPSDDKNSGPWIPVSLRNDYDITDNSPPDNPPDLNSASQLVEGIACLDRSSTRTNLGDPVAAAGSHLLNFGRPDVPNGIVFMTDGAANEPSGSSSCAYAKAQAQLVEQADITIITIAFRLQGVSCGSELATAVLADMASDPLIGPASADDGGDGPGGLPGGCSSPASVAGENTDGDHFLCAPNAGQLTEVFIAASTALTSDLGDRTRLVRLPS
jgi:hypothetical protein